MKGRLIVFEGDRTVPARPTQSQLLCERLAREGVPYKNIDFPRYGKPSAAMVQEYLDGHLGRHPGDVNAYAASLMFSMDRYASYKQDWGAFYESRRAGDRRPLHHLQRRASGVQAAARRGAEGVFGLAVRFGSTGFWAARAGSGDLSGYANGRSRRRMLRQREHAAGTHADIHEQDEAYLKDVPRRMPGTS